MQEMTPAICDSMDLYSSLTLRDDRGIAPQYYRVRKMPDNRCWMIDNLKLELYTGMQLSSADSNVVTTTIITLATGGLTGNFTTSGYLTVDGSATLGTNFDAWRQANPSDPTQINTESCVGGNFVDPASATGCGYLYNWYTATAGVGIYNISSGYVESSICPKGWHLPRGSDNTDTQNDFAILSSAMHGMTNIGLANWWHTGLFSVPLAGHYGYNFVEQGHYGLFWNSSVFSDHHAWYFHLDSVTTGIGYIDKAGGFAVRCLI
jgi:uncharacterized protein (TIGR02145 family)